MDCCVAESRYVFFCPNLLNHNLLPLLASSFRCLIFKIAMRKRLLPQRIRYGNKALQMAIHPSQGCSVPEILRSA